MKGMLTGGFILLVLMNVTVAQQAAQKSTEADKITPGMTEVWEPEVRIIQAGVKDSDPPSDAIVLFNGVDVNKEWEDSKGNPTKWLIQDGALVCVKGSGVIKT